jgi:cobyric acid synthase
MYLAALVGTCQLLVSSDDINVLGENINMIKQNAEVLLDVLVRK